jgi:regulatory protein
MHDPGDDEGGSKRRSQRPKRPPRPLDEASLHALALHYVARYATTRQKLADYLRRKLRERPWDGPAPPDPGAIIARMASLGYVDDSGWAAMKSREMRARGLGPRRIAQTLAAAGVAAPASAENPLLAALRFAEKKRLGPFARTPCTDPAQTRRALAALLRAGHSFDVARQVLAAPTPAAAHALLEA